MRNLCIGISNLTPGWNVVLEQIGVWYEEIDFDSDLIDSYSCLIINETVSRDIKEVLKEYISSGGSVLETDKADIFYQKKSDRKVDFLLNDSDKALFSGIPFIDLYRKVTLIPNGKYFSGLIDLAEDERAIGFLGLDPDEILSDYKYKRRRFPFKDDMHPDEIVSATDKSKVISLITILLKELHYRNGLPFVNKWSSPSEQPYFAFRIDSDFGDESSIRNLYSIGKQYDIPFTWFLHVEAHEDWLHIFREFEKDEIALHGYEHGTSDSYEHVFNNIEKGHQLLNDTQFDVSGFCAPYGLWNETLADVLTTFDYNYSSEFTAGYDGLPFHPVFENQIHPTLQIPIHPVCTGSLNRRHASINEMEHYFMEVLRTKASKHEPVIFYHHPMQPGAEIWKSIFAKVHELGLTPLSFSQIADFWKKRSNAHIKPRMFDEHILRIESDQPEILFQVSSDHHSFELYQNAAEIPLPVIANKTINNHIEMGTELINELRSGRLKLLKTSILDWKNRRRL